MILERERDTDLLFPMQTDQGLNWQPRCTDWETNPQPFWCMGRCSIPLSHAARTAEHFNTKVKYYILRYIKYFITISINSICRQIQELTILNLKIFLISA